MNSAGWLCQGFPFFLSIKKSFLLSSYCQNSVQFNFSCKSANFTLYGIMYLSVSLVDYIRLFVWQINLFLVAVFLFFSIKNIYTYNIQFIIIVRISSWYVLYKYYVTQRENNYMFNYSKVTNSSEYRPMSQFLKVTETFHRKNSCQSHL